MNFLLSDHILLVLILHLPSQSRAILYYAVNFTGTGVASMKTVTVFPALRVEPLFFVTAMATAWDSSNTFLRKTGIQSLQCVE